MLFEQLNNDIIEMMKSKNPDLTILRTLKSDIAKVAIDTKKEVDDGMVVDVAARTVKQFTDAINIYEKVSQDKLVAENKHRIEVVSKYLPAQLSEDEVKSLIAEAKLAVGASSPKDIGKMMKELQPKTKGRFDAKKLSQLVSESLK